uniref:Exonuclease domain-containing protein n=2 Tax=Caenorhabditis japonica TaxID=281687 RepID=A0A8R1DU41_CAEJA
TQIAAKSSAFVESTNLVKSRAVKSAPKYPSFVSKQKGNKMSQKYEFVLVLDFEATCQENSKGPLLPVQEIIEFPVVQLSTKDWKEVRRFHKYIRPTESPRITSFCTSLTGIIQEMVDNQSTLSKVLVEFDTWMKEDSRLQSENFAFVTCGDWDLKVALPNEANFKKIPIPDYFNQWINVKKAYSEHTNQFARGMAQLLQIFKIQHQNHKFERAERDDETIFS